MAITRSQTGVHRVNLRREKIDLKYTEPHYSTRILKAFIVYLREKCGEEYVRKLFYDAGADYEYVVNESNWVSEVFFDNVYQLLASDQSLPRDWGYQIQRYSNHSKHLTVMHRTIAWFLSVKQLYMHLAKLTNVFNKVDHFSLHEVGPDRFVARFQSRRATSHVLQIVEGWKGYLETIPCLVKELPATVDLTQKGDTYEFSVHVNRSGGKKVAKVLTSVHFFLYLLIAAVVVVQGFSHLTWMQLLFYGLMVSVAANLIWMFRKIAKAHESTIQGLIETNKAYEKRYEDLYASRRAIELKNVHAEVLRLVSTFSLKTHRLKRLLDFSLKKALVELRFSRALVLLIDEGGEWMRLASFFGFDDPFQKQVLPHIQLRMQHEKQDPLLFHNLVLSNQSIVVHDVESYISKLEPRNQEIMHLLKVEQFVVAPLFEGASRYGLLVIDRAKDIGVLTEDDIRTVQGLANQLSISIGHFYTQERLSRSQKNLRKSLETTQKIAQFVPKQLKRSIEETSMEDLYTVHHFSTSTVAFVDIAHFASISEILTHHSVVQLLNRIFMVIDPIVEKYDGDIDKRIGDATMVVFSALENGNWEHRASWRAIQCLWEIKQALMHFQFSDEVVGIPRIRLHMGAASGPLIHANIGSPLRLEHTVLGDTVNIAARLEEISEQDCIIVNGLLFQEIQGNVHATPLPALTLRNKAQPVPMYQIHAVLPPHRLLGTSTTLKKAA